MKKKVLSCLAVLSLVLALAFSASADVIPPQGDIFEYGEPESSGFVTPGSEIDGGEIERVDMGDEVRSILAAENGAAADDAEDETVILYGSAEVPEEHTLPDVDVEQVEPAQKSIVKPIVICLAIGLVIALIVVLAVKSGYKPVHRRRDAAEYLVDGSLNVTASQETFIRSERSERRIEKQDSSGSK